MLEERRMELHLKTEGWTTSWRYTEGLCREEKRSGWGDTDEAGKDVGMLMPELAGPCVGKARSHHL